MRVQVDLRLRVVLLRESLQALRQDAVVVSLHAALSRGFSFFIIFGISLGLLFARRDDDLVVAAVRGLVQDALQREVGPLLGVVDVGTLGDVPMLGQCRKLFFQCLNLWSKGGVNLFVGFLANLFCRVEQVLRFGQRQIACFVVSIYVRFGHTRSIELALGAAHSIFVRRVKLTEIYFVLCLYIALGFYMRFLNVV